MIEDFKKDFSDKTKSLNDIQIARILFDGGGGKDGESFPDFAARAGVKINSIDAMGNALADSLTFGTMPIVASSAQAAFDKITGDERPYSEIAEDRRKQFNDFNAVARKQNPYTSFTSDVAGAAAQMISPIGRGVKALAPGGVLAKEAALGGTLGAANAAGQSASRGEDPAQTAFNIGMGTTLGAASAPAGQAVASVVKGIPQAVALAGEGIEKLGVNAAKLPRMLATSSAKRASKDFPGPGASPIEQAVEFDKKFYNDIIDSQGFDTKAAVGKIKDFFGDQNWPNYRPYAFTRDNDLGSVQRLLQTGKVDAARAEFDKVLDTKRKVMLTAGEDPIVVERKMDEYVKGLYKDLFARNVEPQPDLGKIRVQLDNRYPDIVRNRLLGAQNVERLAHELEREGGGGLVRRFFDQVDMNNAKTVKKLMKEYGVSTPDELKDKLILSRVHDGVMFVPKETLRSMLRTDPQAGFSGFRKDVADSVSQSVRGRIGGMYPNELVDRWKGATGILGPLPSNEAGKLIDVPLNKTALGEWLTKKLYESSGGGAGKVSPLAALPTATVAVPFGAASSVVGKGIKAAGKTGTWAARAVTNPGETIAYVTERISPKAGQLLQKQLERGPEFYKAALFTLSQRPEYARLLASNEEE